jgi:hypothetical protein
MKVPSTYQHADKLDPVAPTIFRLAWAIWHGLSPAMRRALVAGWRPCGQKRVRIPLGTLRALHARGLIEGRHATASDWLSNLGLLVREAGTRTQEETS